MNIFHGKTAFQLLKIKFQKSQKYFVKGGLKTLYFSSAHIYLSYGNIVWGSTTRTKLKKIESKQRGVIRVIYAVEYTRGKNGRNKSFKYLQI